MSTRFCKQPGCGNTFEYNGKGRPNTLCEVHRPPDTRKYGGAHQRLRAATRDEWIGQPCVRGCGKLLSPDKPPLGTGMHLDHDEHGGYLGYSCQKCNESAGAHKRNAQSRAAKGRLPSADQVRALGGVMPDPPVTVLRGTWSPGAKGILPQMGPYRPAMAPYVSHTGSGVVRQCLCDRYPGPHEVSAGMVGSRCW